MGEEKAVRMGSDTTRSCRKCSTAMKPVTVSLKVYDPQTKEMVSRDTVVGWVYQCGCKDEEIHAWEKNRKIREFGERQMAANMPMEFINDDFGGWKTTTTNKAMHERVLLYSGEIEKNYADGRGMLISGSPGIGKTRHACYVLARFLEMGTGGYFLSFSQFVRELVYKEQAELNFWELCRIPVVVLDDFGSEKIGERTQVLFKEFFDRRMKGKVTIITTMVKGQVLSVNIGQYLMSRIFAVTMPNVIDCMETRDMRVGGREYV